VKRDYEVETWAPDFDDVKLDTIVMFEHARGTSMWSFQFGVDDVMQELVEGDLLRVVELRGRPRRAKIEALRTMKVFELRVDQLLEWHDDEIVTILPG
jgi:hypothetical protein